jgi:hypothetical protein
MSQPVCFLCNQVKYEGSVCVDCRPLFDDYAIVCQDYDLTEEEEADLEPIYDCFHCSEHNFPCLNCEHYFYRFGLSEHCSYDQMVDADGDLILPVSASGPMSVYDYVHLLRGPDPMEIEI